jgi:cytochrome b pre-mRNA-processing protein 3
LALFATARCCYLIVMFGGLFRRDPYRVEAARLYGVLAEQARQPIFFSELGVPDTVDGRFDLLSLHAALAIERLKQETDGVALSQSLFDAMFRHLDLTLREMGVQDLGVGRRIKIMAEGFHGRGLALREAMAGDDAALTAVLTRNVLGAGPILPGAPERLTRYGRALAAVLAACSRADMLNGKIGFPQP